MPITRLITSDAKTRIRESSSETKNCVSPGSPCRPLLPRSWLSMRRASCRSVPSTNNPPVFFTSSYASSDPGFPPSLMSTPRPAMLVAIVTPPRRPACAMISPSRSWFLAFNTSCGMPSCLKCAERISFFSTDTVPTKTGCPFSCNSRTCRAIAFIFPPSVWKMRSSWSFRAADLLVGTTTVLSPYTL